MPEAPRRLSRVFPVLLLAHLPRRELFITDPRSCAGGPSAPCATILGADGPKRHPLVLTSTISSGATPTAGPSDATCSRPPEPPPLMLLASYRSEYAATSPCLRPFLGALAGPRGPPRRDLAVEAMTPRRLDSSPSSC